MAFRSTDFKKTIRKAKGDAPATLYPHQLKDKKTRARLEVAIRTFDGLVGRRRGEMDAGALVDFFGDPRLARGVVACLGQYYTYRTLRFAEVVGTGAAEHLVQAGLATPIAVRAHTYAHVNTSYDGFLTEATRGTCYAEVAGAFDLTARDWDALMHLDAEENQMLTRTRQVPSAEDLAALYNFHALDTALRRATKIVLAGLTLSPGQAAEVRMLAQGLGVKGAVSGGGDTVTLTAEGAPQATKPGRLARCLLLLAHAHASRLTVGHADVLLGTRRARLLLGADTLKALGAPLSGSQSTVRLGRCWEAGDALHKALLKARVRGEADGWRLRRLPEPVACAQGVLLADLRLTRGAQTAYLVLGDAPAGEWDAPVVALPTMRQFPEIAGVLARVEAVTCNLFTQVAPLLPAVPSDVRALCDRAASQGLVRAGEAQRALHLLEEEPLIEWVRRAADPRVQYVPGIGLCAQELVTALRDAPDPA